jgi:hypothetical protein
VVAGLRAIGLVARKQAHLVVGLLLLALLPACGDGPDPALSDEEPTFAPDDWQFYRDLQPGDCLNAPNELRKKVSCDGDEWYARVYEVIRGDDVKTGACHGPQPDPGEGYRQEMTVPDPPLVTLCMVLREKLRED